MLPAAPPQLPVPMPAPTQRAHGHLAHRLEAFVAALGVPESSATFAGEAKALLAFARFQAPAELRNKTFDALLLLYKARLDELAHGPEVLAFLHACAPARLDAIEAALRRSNDLQTLRRLKLQLLDFKRPPMRDDVIRRADALHAQTLALTPPPMLPLSRQRTPIAFAGDDAWASLVKPLELLAVHKTKVRGGVPRHYGDALSHFLVPGQEKFSGLVSPTVQRGAYCKLRMLFTGANETYAVRQASTQGKPPGSAKLRRKFADGSCELNFALRATDPARYLSERQAQRLARSPLMPLLTLYEGKKRRLFEVLPLYEGDLHGLCDTFGEGEVPGGLMVMVAQAVLQVVTRLHEHGWQHNDVKPENILWRRTSDHGGEVVLADFGLALPVRHGARVGTAGYFDPEAYLRPEHHGGLRDLYSLAMTIVHLVEPANFAEFPLAVQASEGLVGAAAQAVKVYAEWRAWYDGARGRDNLSPDQLSDPAYEVERVRRLMQARAGVELTSMVFLHWCQPCAEHRGEPRSHLRQLDQAFPANAPALLAAQQSMRSAAQQDAFCRRLDATTAALVACREAGTVAAPAATKSFAVAPPSGPVHTSAP